jgi:hypothetical protein
VKALSDTQKMKFLTALQTGNSVTRACELSAVGRRTAYYWRSEDQEFADAWQEALDSSVEVLEDKVRARALDDSDPKSHIMLMFLLKKLRPEYRENYKEPAEKTKTKVQEFDFSVEEMEKARALLGAALSAAEAAKPSEKEE